ncbi:MAG: biotin-dependent carboxyltransferase family protein [Rhodocyclales bacterium]|nr:biotin-dependent carboxyltransferase family protein [Rhodocyclales bacterium]
MIEVLAAPLPASIQDLGRPGYRHLGVPLSGALDAEWLALANALTGNPPATAGLEMRLMGPRLRFGNEVTLGLAGEFSAVIDDADGTRRRAANWRSHTLNAGDVLDLGPLRSGIGYLAVHGGFDVPNVLGSRSTYARASMGGLNGRTIAAGDRLNIRHDGSETPNPLRLPHAPPLDAGPIRLIAGPQHDYFTDAAWDSFVSGEYTVTRDADRMGLRLDGPILEHNAALGADIVSDAVAPGAIQVPGDGRPIVLLADCQTVGGYPKIATVIHADVRRLGHLLPGQKLRFTVVSIDEAIAARRCAAQALATCIGGILPVASEYNLDALYGANLIDGVIDAGTAY